MNRIKNESQKNTLPGVTLDDYKSSNISNHKREPSMNTFIEGAPVPPPTESEKEKVETEPSLNSNQGFPPPPPPLQMPGTTMPNMSQMPGMPPNMPFNGQPDFNNPDQMAAMNQWMMMNPYIFQMAAQMANQMAASGQVPPMPGMGQLPNMPAPGMGNLPAPGMGSPQSSSNQPNPFNSLRRNSSSSSVGSVSIPVEHFDANGNKIERK